METIDNILLYDGGSKNTYDCLGVYGIEAKKCLEMNNEYDNYQCEYLLVTSLYNRFGSWIRNAYQPLIETYTSKAYSGPERIFISRNKAHSRRIANEEEIQHILIEYDIHIIHNEDLDLASQVQCFHHAGFIMGPHGANLVNAVFAKPGTILCEISNARVNHFYNQAYWKIAQSMQLEYHVLYANINIPESVAKKGGPSKEEDLWVDKIRLRNYLEHIFGRVASTT